MTPTEEAAIDAFAKEVVSQTCPSSTTNAALKFVVLATARTAAKMAARDGTIKREDAVQIFQEAVRRMSEFKP